MSARDLRIGNRENKRKIQQLDWFLPIFID